MLEVEVRRGVWVSLVHQLFLGHAERCAYDVELDPETILDLVFGFVLWIHHRELIEQGLEVVEVLVELRRQVSKESRRVPEGRAALVESEKLASLEPEFQSKMTSVFPTRDKTRFVTFVEALLYVCFL